MDLDIDNSWRIVVEIRITRVNLVIEALAIFQSALNLLLNRSQNKAEVPITHFCFHELAVRIRNCYQA